jgi:endonuclease-3
MTRRDRSTAIAGRLECLYPDARCLLDYSGDPRKLLLATALSAQTTDDSVNRVTPRLWKRWPDLESLAAAPVTEVEKVIHPLGFFRSKARSLVGAAAWLLEHHCGDVPSSMEELVRIPGVGRKTANVVRGEAFGLPAIIVDTHVKRLSYRMGLTRSEDPDRIELDLARILPSSRRTAFSHRLGFHGRRVCSARSPKCASCALLDLCPRRGLKTCVAIGPASGV